MLDCERFSVRPDGGFSFRKDTGMNGNVINVLLTFRAALMHEQKLKKHLHYTKGMGELLCLLFLYLI